jgi:hypothetical protein
MTGKSSGLLSDHIYESIAIVMQHGYLMHDVVTNEEDKNEFLMPRKYQISSTLKD